MEINENNPNAVFPGTHPVADCPIDQMGRIPGDSDLPDDELVRRSRQGDMNAYGRLVLRYQDRLFNMVLRMVANRDDALELTQDALVRALQGLKRFRGQSGFYTWLFRIAYNLCLNHSQRRARVRFTSLHSDPDVTGRQADGLAALIDKSANLPPRQAELNEAHQRVLRALDSLEPDLRALVILRDLEQLDYAHIAKITDQPLGTVKSRLFRARQTLREQLLEKKT